MRRVLVSAGLSLALCACLSAANLTGGDPPADGGATLAEACVADLQNDVGNCGACGKVCGNHANAYGMCKGGACAIGCNTGYGDCDGKIETGCESPLATDPNHCGACGHACGGARCVGGQCQPFTLAEVPGYVVSATTDATHIYYAYDGGGGSYAIGRTPKDGSAPPSAVVTGITKPPYALTVTDAEIYWVKTNEANGPPPAQPDGQVFRSPKAGGAVGAPWLAGLRTTQYFAVADGNAFIGTSDYTARTSAIGRAALTGKTVVDNTTAIPGFLYALRVDGSFVYFFNSGDDTGANRGLRRCPTTGCGAASTLVPNLPGSSYVYDILPYGGFLYFSVNSRSIVRIKPTGEAYQSLVSSEDAYSSRISSFAVDATSLYWIESTYGGGGGGGADVYTAWTCSIANCQDGKRELLVRGRASEVFVDDKAAYFLTQVAAATGTATQILKVMK
ncbi:MAG: hypothetical protein JST00_37675 [Deltaproteobacteria bacterium]|nr:hypothetical protein [Deltaproteobacteria bacterium]